MDMHHYGFLIAQIFFALWLVPLGVLLVVAGGSYLVDMLAAFLFPEIGAAIHGFLAIPPTIAEVWTLVYLLVVGVKTVKPVETARVVTTAAA